MTLAPNYRLSQEDGKMIRVRRQSEAHMAVTRYKVLSSANSCCLLELQPATGKSSLQEAGAGFSACDAFM